MINLACAKKLFESNAPVSEDTPNRTAESMREFRGLGDRVNEPHCD